MIPVNDLSREYLSLEDELKTAVQEVMAGGRYILGPAVEAFEAEFAAYSGARYGVAVGSGTDAIRLALLASGLKPGDEVITVSFTAAPTVAAIMAAGGKPVLVDIDPQTLLMDVSQVAAAITPRTVAIVPVHLFGLPVDMDPLMALAKRQGLLVIEDACQAHGSEYKGRKAGGIGDIGCFSFYPTKNLGAFGDGGMVLTNDGEVARRVRLLRNHGQERRFYSVVVSSNSRLDDLQAAILRVKLRHLDEQNEQRRRLAELYTCALQGLSLALPAEPAWARSNRHLYVVRVEKREDFRRRLAAAGADSDVHYPLPVHLQTAYESLGCKKGSLPASEEAARTVVTLPLFPSLTEEEAMRVVEAVRVALER